jgi:hypothetical protein
MQETNPAQEPELGTVYFVHAPTADSHGVFDDRLRIVTEDGRVLRITAIRHPNGIAAGTEIVVAEGGA